MKIKILLVALSIISLNAIAQTTYYSNPNGMPIPSGKSCAMTCMFPS